MNQVGYHFPTALQRGVTRDVGQAALSPEKEQFGDTQASAADVIGPTFRWGRTLKESPLGRASLSGVFLTQQEPTQRKVGTVLAVFTLYKVKITIGYRLPMDIGIHWISVSLEQNNKNYFYGNHYYGNHRPSTKQ